MNSINDPLDDPEYLRNKSRRFRKIISELSDPEIKKELASHSFNLAQRAEAVGRIKEDQAEVRKNVERFRSVPQSGVDPAERQRAMSQSGHTPNAHAKLRELAAWYRTFAERAGNPVIWEARLQTAEDLDAEPERVERRNQRIDPSHGKTPVAG